MAHQCGLLQYKCTAVDQILLAVCALRLAWAHCVYTRVYIDGEIDGEIDASGIFYK